MSNLLTKTTFSQAMKGEPDCLEMAFEQLANKIENGKKLKDPMKHFLVQHLRGY